MKCLYLLLIITLFSCRTATKKVTKIANPQLTAVRQMIAAVNEKDATAYVADFADSVKILVEGVVKVDGKAAVRANRMQHFERHPQVRSEIQHLVEIDERVIMHDKVWLRPTDERGQDIVEIFTFVDGEVVQMEVIQPKNLFSNNE